MIENLVPFLTFTFITAFTPGPNNLTCASFSMVVGYRKLIPYMAGIVSGVVLVFSSCIILSGSLVAIMPMIEPYMRYIGAA